MLALLNKKKKKKGFTLIELIVVIAILAILAALAIPRFVGVQNDAKIKSDIANAKTIHDAVATLITQDKIQLDTNTKYIDPDKAPASVSDTSTTTQKDDFALKSYLQTMPTPKYKTGLKFVVSVSSSGDVLVYTASSTSDHATSGTNVYPNGVSPYNQ